MALSTVLSIEQFRCNVPLQSSLPNIPPEAGAFRSFIGLTSEIGLSVSLAGDYKEEDDSSPLIAGYWASNPSQWSELSYGVYEFGSCRGCGEAQPVPRMGTAFMTYCRACKSAEVSDQTKADIKYYRTMAAKLPGIYRKACALVEARLIQCKRAPVYGLIGENVETWRADYDSLFTALGKVKRALKKVASALKPIRNASAVMGVMMPALAETRRVYKNEERLLEECEADLSRCEDFVDTVDHWDDHHRVIFAKWKKDMAAMQEDELSSAASILAMQVWDIAPTSGAVARHCLGRDKSDTNSASR